MSEQRQEFENALENIESKVIELFAMIAEDVPLATQALLNGDSDAYQTLAERDLAIDALYREVEGLANREILLQAPVAADLRFLLSVLRIVPELERTHDLVVHIGASAGHLLGEDLTPRAKGLVDKQYAEFLAVLGMAAETNTLANSLQIPVDREFLIS